MCGGEVELTAFATHLFPPRDPLTDSPFPLSHLVHAPRATCGQIRDARSLCRAHEEALHARGGLEVGCLFKGELTLKGRLKVCHMWCMGKLIVSAVETCETVAARHLGASTARVGPRVLEKCFFKTNGRLLRMKQVIRRA
jgi:hypothetical protein